MIPIVHSDSGIEFILIFKSLLAWLVKYSFVIIGKEEFPRCLHIFNNFRMKTTTNFIFGNIVTVKY